MKFFIGIIFSLIASIILSLAIFVLVNIIQAKMFVPNDYIMWISKSPYSKLILIYEYYIILVFIYMLTKKLDHFEIFFINLKSKLIKNNKIYFISIFLILNIVLAYTILYNVSVVTDNSIINYSFLSPFVKEYSYNDIIKINTGIYAKKGFTHSKGDFYYIIELNDGIKIDLAEMGGSKDDEDPRFIIEKLDIQYFNMRIDKTSSMDNFQYATEILDKIYTDKIQNILLNVK